MSAGARRIRGRTLGSRTPLLLAAGVGLLCLPASAAAATAALDRPCYVSGQPGTLSLAGFSPNAVVSVANAELGATKVTTDATGSFALAITPPSGNDLKRPGSRGIVFTATEDANPANTATAASRIAPLSFATDTGTKSPKAQRSWAFSGWEPGKPVYAHFRFGGKTRGTYRFGVAAGPCGELRRRAPGIAIKGSVRAGSWTIQVDQSPRYSVSTKPFLKDKTVVFTTFRRRAVPTAAALNTAPATGIFGFAGF